MVACGHSTLCCTFLQLTLTGRYPAFCSVKLGLSSRARAPAVSRAPLTATACNRFGRRRDRGHAADSRLCYAGAMKRYAKPFLGLGLLLSLGGGSWYAWHRAHPPPVPKEKRFEDIDPQEYEKWMQDLGYTE